MRLTTSLLALALLSGCATPAAPPDPADPLIGRWKFNDGLLSLELNVKPDGLLEPVPGAVKTAMRAAIQRRLETEVRDPVMRKKSMDNVDAELARQPETDRAYRGTWVRKGEVYELIYNTPGAQRPSVVWGRLSGDRYESTDESGKPKPGQSATRLK